METFNVVCALIVAGLSALLTCTGHPWLGLFGAMVAVKMYQTTDDDEEGV